MKARPRSSINWQRTSGGLRIVFPALVVAALAVSLGDISAQVLLSPAGYRQDFDAHFDVKPTEFPDGWSGVNNSKPINTIYTSDDEWAGRMEDPPGAVCAYNAALQTDVNAVGDALADRGLAIYATDPNKDRYLQLDLINDTGERLTQLDLNFNIALYAARRDSAHPDDRWDGLVLEYNQGDGFIRSDLEATFSDDDLTFDLDPGIAAGGNPWNAIGWGWATADMIPDGPKKSVSGSITGLNLANGGLLTLRWTSRSGDGLVTPSQNSGLHQNMLVGVDDLVVTIPSTQSLRVLSIREVETSQFEITFQSPASDTRHEIWSSESLSEFSATGVQATTDANGIGTALVSSPTSARFFRVVLP